jgi:hypothetical protein
MSRMFNWGRVMAESSRQNDTSDKLIAEARNYPLAKVGGFLALVKYVIFAILGSLNFHLFYTHVRAPWGLMLGITAVLFECCAVYFWNQQNKSAGKHKLALQFFAITFTLISFVHGCAALYQLNGAGPDLAGPIRIYSDYIAFPLLFLSMIIAVSTLYFLHWSTEISGERAKTLQEVEKSRAQLITETVRMEHEFQVEKERFKYFQLRMAQEAEYVDAIKEYALIKQRGDAVLASITDADTRRTLYATLGKISREETLDKQINSPVL